MVLFRLFQRGFNGMLSGAALYIMILFAGGRNIHRIPLWRRFLCAGGVLRFAPVAVIFGALVAGFHRLIGAHTHIVFFAVFQSGNVFLVVLFLLTVTVFAFLKFDDVLYWI